MKRNVKVLRKIFVFALVCLLISQSVFATPTQEEQVPKESMAVKVEKLKSKRITVGRVQKSKEGFKIGDTILPAYHCMNVSYVLVSDLKQVGGNVSWDSVTGRIVIHDLNRPISENLTFETLVGDSIGYLGRDAVYINHQEVPAIFVGGKAMIPAKWIPAILIDWTITSAEAIEENQDLELEVVDPTAKDPEEIEDSEDIEEVDTIEIEEVQEVETVGLAGIETEEKGIKGINIWFDGKDYIEKPFDFSQLQAGEFGYYKDHSYNDNPAYMYLGFVISKVDGLPNIEGDKHKAWLKNPTYYTVPEGLSPQVLMTLFPDTRVKGIMKYAAGGFAKGETVNVKQASTGRSYHLINSSGKTVTVPWNSVTIQKSPVSKEQATTQQIEAYINSKDFSSKTKYFVWTDIYRQRTYVFEGSKNNWKLIKNFLCSTGKDIQLTPVGRYTLNVRVPYFGTKDYRVKNAYAFIGTSYLYHSTLYNSTGTYELKHTNALLGSKASSGCIRLAPEDSVWFYKTLPIGTGIFIN